MQSIIIHSFLDDDEKDDEQLVIDDGILESEDQPQNAGETVEVSSRQCPLYFILHCTLCAHSRQYDMLCITPIFCS